MLDIREDNMTERALTSLFSKFLKSHPREDTECYEFKMVKANTFNFKTVKEHQVLGLMTSLEGLWHKISDSPIYSGMKTSFTNSKPFDAVFIKAKRAYVVPIFYKERKYKRAFLIPIKEFVRLTKTRKSIKMTELESDHKIERIYL